MSNTIMLDPTTWDWVLDSAGNVAVATGAYAFEQDVASAVRTFLGEVYYDTSQGVPYFQQILGRSPPLSLFKAKIVAAALTVPGVTSATCTVTSIAGRKLAGSIQFTTTGGATGNVQF